MRNFLRGLLLLLVIVVAAREKGPAVCTGKLCDCDKQGEIDCKEQNLKTANVDPVVNPESVKTLSFKNNQITRIHRNGIMFGQGKQLTQLILSENLINQIDDHAFESTPALENLDLRNNKLTNLTQDTFSGLANLANLWLEHNLINDLTSCSAFSSLPNLRYLSLDWTPIRNVDNQSFIGLDMLVDLSIDHAELSMLPAGTFKPLVRLELLSLRHNRFHVIPLEELRWLSQLRHIDLSGNPILTINSNAFRHNPHLHTLTFVNMTDLNYIEDCAFCNVHELRTLQITNCSKLNDIDPEAFGRDTAYFRSIETIDLANNSLTVLNDDLLAWENVTGVIRLAGNPWKCGCDLLWMISTVIKFDKSEPPVCATPARLKGKTIPTLDRYAAGLCLTARLSSRIRAARVFLVAAALVVLFGIITSTWYFVSNRRQKGLKLRNLFYKPQLPKYAYRNLAMGEENDDVLVVSNDGAAILPKSNRKGDLASSLADDS